MEKRTSLKNILIGGVILLVSVGVVYGFRYTKQAQKDKSAGNAVSSLGKVRGPDSAPIRILDFSDFQCPACRLASLVAEELIQKYPGKIQLVFKHFPLRMHPWALVAHQSAECANMQGKFWQFYDKMYQNQQVWSILSDPLPTFASYAQEIGLNMTDFEKCMVNPQVAAQIAAEKKEGEALEVKSTPTFFINGQMFAGGVELQVSGQSLIRKMLGLPEEKVTSIPPVSSLVVSANKKA